ncbi:MAG TPA: HemK2/MTQ2 family protein methyltransferase [Croceibacterium sp.]|nr:HemK2/MTQ2 family protein methyltransferase [Croceibacterium sp.]
MAELTLARRDANGDRPACTAGIAGERPTRVRGAAAALARGWLALRRFGRGTRGLVLETIDGVPLVVLPQVFNPVRLRSGALMARALNRLPLDDPARLAVLDLGTGSGIGAVFAARRGATVAAVDINPEAVRCARINALLNHAEDRIAVHLGDLFEPVRGRSFDLILFNPPFYRGRPRDDHDHAWRGLDVFERFAAGLDRALAPGGCVLLTLSTDGDGAELLDVLVAAGFAVEVVEQTDLLNEVITVYGVRRGAAVEGP